MDLRAFLSFECFTSDEKHRFAANVIEEIVHLESQTLTRRLILLCLMRWLQHHDFLRMESQRIACLDKQLEKATTCPALFLENNQDLELLAQCADFAPVGDADVRMFIERESKNPQVDFFHQLLLLRQPRWPELQRLKNQPAEKNVYRENEKRQFLARNLAIVESWHSQQERDAVVILSKLLPLATKTNMTTFVKRCDLYSFSPLVRKKLTHFQTEFCEASFNGCFFYDHVHVPAEPNQTFMQELIHSTDVLLWQTERKAILLEDVEFILTNAFVQQNFKRETLAVLSNVVLLNSKSRHLGMVNKMFDSLEVCDLEIMCNVYILRPKDHDLLNRCRVAADNCHDFRTLSLLFIALCHLKSAKIK